MARIFNVGAGRVEVFVERVDDGAGVFRDGTKVLHVHYKESDRVAWDLGRGQQADIKLEVYNVTGGPYEATITINAAGRRIYQAIPRGWTFPGWSEVVWTDSFTLLAQ
jgi:hypothetical protein